MKISSFKRWSEVYFLILFAILAIGTPLIFTSLTRSVFEVNKMLLMRLVSIFIGFGWVFRTVVLDAHGYSPEGKILKLGPLKWEKIGIEIPLALVVLLDVVSTVFSQNVRLSVIGAYDRWEGILTALNYVVLLVMTAKLVTRRFQIKWLLVALLVPCAISAVYGVAQSLGYDFMQWSVDPTKRVFACINNPVHFCAYMGMMVPVGMSTLLYVTSAFKRTSLQAVAKWFLFIMVGLIFYAQYLSFSRATWFGFALAMPIFFMVVLGLMRTENSKSLVGDFFLTLFGIVTFYLYYIFNFHLKGLSVAAILTTLNVGALLGTYWICRRYYSKVGMPSLREFVIPVIGTAGLFFAFIFNWGDISPYIVWPLRLVGIAAFGAMVKISVDAEQEYLSRLVILGVFANLQFVALSFTNIMLYSLLLVAFLGTNLRGNQNLQRENKLWLFGFLVAFGLVISVPAIPEMIHSLQNPNSEDVAGLQAVSTVQQKLESYKKDAMDGSARVSMWKSSVPWIKDYWLIGSGLDTIKYMYPIYRRPEYGILEGGHNFTPDRLHNEYLNTMATKGIPATLIYYFGVIVGWYVIVLRGLVKLNRSPMKYFALAFMLGATVYLGQVLFNFGVIATLVLFYTFMGLAWAIVTHSDFEEEQIESL